MINKEFEFAYRDCAEMCFETRKYHKALQCYQEVLDLFDPDQDIFLRVGQCYQHLGNYAIAKNFYENAVRLDPMNDEVYFHLGECFAHEGSWKKAIRASIARGAPKISPIKRAYSDQFKPKWNSCRCALYESEREE